VIQNTLVILKPGAVRRHGAAKLFRAIHTKLPDAQLMRSKWLMVTPEQAMEFYAEHEGRSFFNGLIDHTISGPCLAVELSGENIIQRWRDAMGATDPKKAAEDTLRWHFGKEVPDNAFHGSDSPASAKRELGLIFGAPVQLKFKRLVPEAMLPTRGSVEAAGLDLYCIDDVVVKPGITTKVRTGLAVSFPKGYEIQLRARSGLAAKHTISVVNGPGTIDSDFRGELMALLTTTPERGHYTFIPGDRVAQIVLSKLVDCEVVEVDELDETERGAGGWGHTGR
jgi:dUTP pyrophosphatase